MRKLATIVVAGVLSVLLLASPAAAGTEHVSRSSRTVTGADAAAGVLRDIERVQLGAGTTTVTVSTAGVPHDVVIDYADVFSSTTADGGTNPVMPLVTLSVGAVALQSVLRLLQTLSRLKGR